MFCSVPSFWYQTKFGTRMRDRLAKFLVQDSGTRNSDGELGSCAMGLIGSVAHLKLMCFISNCLSARSKTEVL